MQKQVLRFSIVLVLGLFIYALCEYFVPVGNFISAKPGSQDAEIDNLTYLNDIRSKLGLAEFKINSSLVNSAAAHAKYLATNDILSHDESADGANFYAQTPAQRAIKSGYSHSYAIENVSKNDSSPHASIDNLLSAIYHRFGFLNFDLNEIGFASDKNKENEFYAYEMGNIVLGALCKMSVNSQTNETYILDLCANGAKVPKSEFEFAIKRPHPEFIAFPTHNLGIASFSGETPNPIPECKITSNPVSIEFNPKFNAIKMLNFELFKGKNKLENTIILDKLSDVNSKFNERQFAVFSKDVFEFGEKYRAVFSYLKDGGKKKIEWEFTTKTPKFDYFSVKNGDKIGVLPNKTYDIFFTPKDCNDKLDSYSYQVGSFMQANVSQSGANTLRVSLDGLKGDFLRLKAVNSEVKIYLLEDSPLGARNRIYILVLIACMEAWLILAYLREIRRKNG